MCGIIGIISKKLVANKILECLERLEYRGYDSAGIATIYNHQIQNLKIKGKILNLKTALNEKPIQGNIGIGHTRWATHGIPSIENAHPHQNNKVAVVHNGIIENYRLLKAELIEKNYKFISETDTEVIPHLISLYLSEGNEPFEAVKKCINRLEGAFAIGVIFSDYPDLIIGARKGSPLVVGYGDEEIYLGSDSYALAPLTNNISFLDENDIVVINHDKVEFFDLNSQKVNREIKKIMCATVAGKGNYRHFMLKEIYEQPTIASNIFSNYIDFETNSFKYTLPFEINNIPKITLIACGSSYYAAMIAKYWFENIAGITVEIEIASEFRYRKINLPEGGLAIFISQSGETADTLAALKYARTLKQHILSLVNVAESSIARESDFVLNLYAGPEIGVASTKAFTAALCVLATLVLQFAKNKNIEIDFFLNSLQEVPGKIAQILNMDKKIQEVARGLSHARDVIYMGRGVSYPVALEGALKLKELSYIHAEAVAAGELKHGPIALIDEEVTIIAIIPPDHLFDKTASNISEVEARGGKMVVITSSDGKSNFNEKVTIIEICETNILTQAIIYSIPIQLISYHTAVYKGTDVDQPRNLAKSVTVE